MLTQARFCEPLPENAAVVDTLNLLAKFEGSLAAGLTPNAAPGQETFNRRVMAGFSHAPPYMLLISLSMAW